jgi:hypothetical protein
VFSWDVYHIENYFIEIPYIGGVLRSLGLGNALTEEQIADELRNSAAETLQQLLRHELSEVANTALIAAINVGTDPKKGDLAGELFEAVTRSVDRVQSEIQGALNLNELQARERELRTKYQAALADGSWSQSFRGRDVLRRFAGKHAGSVQYEVFRNLILSRMQDDGFQPAGMRVVVEQILAN